MAAVSTTDVAQADSIGKSLADAFVGILADTPVQVRVAYQIARTSPAIEVAAAGVFLVRDTAPVRTFDFVGAAGGGHATPVFAGLVRSTGVAASPAMVVGKLQVNAFVATGDESRARAAARAVQAGQVAVTCLPAAAAMRIVARGIDAEIPAANLGSGTRSNTTAVHARDVGATEVAAPIAVLGIGQRVHAYPVAGDRACRAVFRQFPDVARITGGRADLRLFLFLALLLVGMHLVTLMEVRTAVSSVLLVGFPRVTLKADESGGQTEQATQSRPP